MASPSYGDGKNPPQVDWFGLQLKVEREIFLELWEHGAEHKRMAALEALKHISRLELQRSPDEPFCVLCGGPPEIHWQPLGDGDCCHYCKRCVPAMQDAVNKHALGHPEIYRPVLLETLHGDDQDARVKAFGLLYAIDQQGSEKGDHDG